MGSLKYGIMYAIITLFFTQKWNILI